MPKSLAIWASEVAPLALLLSPPRDAFGAPDVCHWLMRLQLRALFNLFQLDDLAIVRGCQRVSFTWNIADRANRWTAHPCPSLP